MPSAFDLLGTVFGVLSLLGCFKSVYGFLKNRQPLAQADLLEEALREARQRVHELERYGYLSKSLTLLLVYKSALAKLERESLRARAQAEQHRPKSIIATFVYSWRHGVNCTLSRQIGTFTKLVRGIRRQLDYPVENLDTDYSLTLGQLHPRQEPDRTTFTGTGNTVDVQSAATGTQVEQNTEGMSRRRIGALASDPPVDADMASQIYAIREVRMKRLQEQLEIIAKTILRRTELAYGFPSNIVRLNQRLLIDGEMLPSEDSSVDSNTVEPTSTPGKRPGIVAGLIYKLIRVLASPFVESVQEEAHDMTVVGETPDEAEQREAAVAAMRTLNKWFEEALQSEFYDGDVQGSHITAKLRNRPWARPK